MWYRIADRVIRFRIPLLILLFAFTAFMAYETTKVELSYDFTSAIPTNNPKYRDYMMFKKTFGDDGNNMMVGIQSDKLFQPEVFNDYIQLTRQLATVDSVENVLAITNAVAITTDSAQKLSIEKIFPDSVTSENIDSLKDYFLNQKFYQGLLYNANTHTYLMAIRINKDVLASADRIAVINKIVAECEAFGAREHIQMHYSGLPFIRTQMANKVNHELKLFLIMSFVFTAVILFLFFRSVSAVFISMVVVAIGVVWSW